MCGQVVVPMVYCFPSQPQPVWNQHERNDANGHNEQDQQRFSKPGSRKSGSPPWLGVNESMPCSGT